MLHLSTLCDHCYLFFFFCFLFFYFFVFLGLALHNIHAFHSKTVFVSSFQNKKEKKIKKKEKEKREANCVLHYFLGFEIKVG